MTPGKLIVINMVLIVIAVKLGLSSGAPVALVAFGPIVYFWGSLFLYTNWFRWHANLKDMIDSTLDHLLNELVGGGPYGRNTPETTRVMSGKDAHKKILCIDRMTQIYQELAIRETNQEQKLKLTNSIEQWKSRTP